MRIGRARVQQPVWSELLINEKEAGGSRHERVIVGKKFAVACRKILLPHPKRYLGPCRERPRVEKGREISVAIACI